MRLTVIGTGYLGAVHAACMAGIGHDVLGVDVDAAKVSALAEGRPPFYEPGFSELLARTVRSGRLCFSTSLTEAAAFGEVHFICVGTPQHEGNHAADLRYVDALVDGLAPYLRHRCLVVGKSTVPVGTAARIGERLARLSPAGADAEIAWNPEFLREGFAVRDTLAPDRLVAGVRSPWADDTLREVYAPMLGAGVPYLSTDLATAELVTMAANAFLATKISFINAMAEVCDTVGADVVALADAIGLDTRIGRRALSAGLGFGGGCLPKDIRAFRARATELGLTDVAAFLREVDDIHQRQRRHTIDLARELVGGSFAGRNIAVLGAAFKPESDDVRDSPALGVATALWQQGARIRVHDPEAMDNARAHVPSLEYVQDVSKACEDADLVLHLTEWQQYRELDPAAIAAVVRSPTVLDARNALDADLWRSGGWVFRALGRPEHPAVIAQPTWTG